MRTFDYIKIPEKLLTPEIVQMVASIHEHKGKQELFLEANIDELNTLLEVALIQSTGASNRIEGIFTSDKRLEELVSQKAEPRNRSEQEIVGYREVLATIHESYEYIIPRPNVILQLHRDLYLYSQGATGGNYKNSDNDIAETDAEGHQKIRFIPVPAFQTADAIEKLCSSFLDAWEADRIDKLILIPMFILDFLCIHPFNDDDVIIRTKLRKPNKIKGLHDLVLIFLCSGRRSSTIPFLAFCLKAVHILLANNMQKKCWFHLEAIKATKSSEG